VHSSIQEGIYGMLSSCDIDLKKQYYQNISLAGWSSKFIGFPERLESELKLRVTQPGITVKVNANAEREFSAWIGGSIMASLSTFSRMWVTKAEYEETGAKIVHTKCF